MMRSCLFTVAVSPDIPRNVSKQSHPPLLRLSDRRLLLPIRPAGLLWPLDAVDTTTSQTKQLQRKDSRKR
jgi:hypothetical protein